MKKIYFASDAHLGAKTLENPLDTERRLVRWLDRIKSDAEAIYFMGDMIDFWFEYKTVVPRGYVRFFGKVAELSDSGIDIHWFIGNHDLWLTDYISTELGVKVHRQAMLCTLKGRSFFLSHGDEFGDPKDYKFRIIRAIFHNSLCRKAFSGIHPRWTIGFAHAWSRQSRIKGEKYSNYLGEEKEHLVLFAKQYLKQHPAVDFFVFGHRHIPLDLMLSRETRLIILGDWITHFSYGVLDEEGFSLELENEAAIK